MNWTGGRLARHSGPAKNSIQKQHFARVKQNLQGNIHGNQPVRYNILNRVVEEQIGAHWPMRPTSPRSDNGEHQVRHVQSSIPHRSLARKGSAHSSRAGGQQEYHKVQIRIKRERLDDQEGDIYDASPPRRDVKRRRKDTDDLHDEDRKEMDIDERRKRLLRKGNWIGSAALAPPKVIFNSPTREDKFGKRRRLTEQDRSLFDARRAHMPVAVARRSNPPQIPSSNNTFSKTLGKADVRISIGGREVPPGISSSAKPSRTSGQLPMVNPPTVNRASLSSSVMLLDNESSPSVAAQLHETRRRDNVRSSPPPAPNLQNIWSRQESHSVKEDWNYRLSQRDFVSAYGSEQRRSLRSSSRSHNHFMQQSDVPAAMTSPMSAMRIRAMNGQMAYSSSSAQIQHPMPQTFKVFSHFRSNSSNFAESNVAQVGMRERESAGLRFQVLDNDIWNAWMAPLPEESDGDQANPRQTPGISISPGVSALPDRHKRLQNFLSTSSESQDQSSCMYQESDGARREPGNLDADELVGARQEDVSIFNGNYERSDTGSARTVTSRISDSFCGGISEHGSRELRQDSYARREDKHETSKAQLSQATIPVLNTFHKSLSGIKMPHIEAKASPDDIWKRFVFGSGGNDSDSDDTSPWRTKFAWNNEEEFTTLSMAAQQSTGNQWSSSFPGRHQRMGESAGNQMPPNFNSLSSSSIMIYGKLGGNSKHQKHHYSINITEPIPRDYDGYSSRAVKGTVATSSIDSPAVLKRVVAHYSSSSISFEDGSSRKKDIVFTKPNQFFGHQSAGLDIDRRDEILHIGRGLMGRTQGRRRQTNQRTTEKMGSFADDIWKSEGDEMDDPIEE